jgi:hypothetical protein
VAYGCTQKTFGKRRSLSSVVSMKGAVALLLVSLLFQYASAVDHFCSERETKFYLEEVLSLDISSVTHLEQGACQIKFADGRYSNTVCNISLAILTGKYCRFILKYRIVCE